MPEDRAELCHPVDEAFEMLDQLLNGQPRKTGWVPLPMELIQEDEGRPLRQVDCPWCTDCVLLFRQQAVEKLRPILEAHGELLAINGAVELQLFNATCVLDALDEGVSSIARFRSGGILEIRRYAFRAEVLGEYHLFKIPNWRVSPIYVSDVFVDAWTSANLRGLTFKEIWTNRPQTSD